MGRPLVGLAWMTPGIEFICGQPGDFPVSEFVRCPVQVETSVARVPAGGDAAGAAAAIPGLVWAFRIHSDGSPEALPVDKPVSFTHDGLLWLHFNLADARALQWLASADLQCPGPGAGAAAVQGQLPADARDRRQRLWRALRPAARHRRYHRGNRLSALCHDRANFGQRPASCALRGRCHPPRAGRRPSH